MRGRLVVALIVVAALVAVSGSGGSAAEPAAPAYALISPTSGRATTLVRVDPTNLKPAPGGLAIREGLAFGGRSPDGRSAIFFEYRRPSLQLVDLEALEVRRSVVVAPTGWRVRAAAWLTADRVAAVVQKMRGSYNQILDRREVVLVDPFAGRVVARREVPGAVALTGSAAGGDKLVLLLGRGDARTRAIRIAVLDAAGNLREATADLGRPTGLRLPALAVDPAGNRAFVVASGAPVIEVDLESMATSAHALTGGGALTENAPLGSRQVVALGDGKLAVAGHNGRRERGVEVSRPAGLAVIDTSTWQVRIVDREASGVSVSGTTLLAYSFRIDRVLHRGRAIQRATGIGMRAYTSEGTRLWQRYGKQPLTANAFRQVALVYRHASPPVGWGRAFVIGLRNGREIRSHSPRQNLWLLPDVPGARPVRAPAAAAAGDALEVKDGNGSFEASVRADVTRVVATLVDGSDHELTIVDGTVSHTAATPEQRAQTLQAFAEDKLVASISLSVDCGGSAGPCATAAAPAESEAVAILRSQAGSRLAVVDPQTLKPLPGGSVALSSTTSASALSADGRFAAVGSSEGARVRVFDTERLSADQFFTSLAPGNADVRALAWLAPDRLLAVVQRYNRSDRRAVSARELVVLDPTRRALVRRKQLPIGRAIVDIDASGGRFVAVLRSSNHRGTGITVLVADAEGRVRSREIRLRQTDGVLPETRLTLERGGKRAFLFAWRRTSQEGPEPLREIDLDRLTITSRRVTVGDVRFQPPAGFTARAASFGEHGVLLSGPFVPLRDAANTPAAGTFLLDTRTFRISQLDPRAHAFMVAGDRAYTFGSTALLSPPAPRGIGVSAYSTSGKRLYHAFGTRTFSQLVLADGVGHLYRHDQANGVAFELESGRSLGPRPTPDGEIEILMPTESTATPVRRPAATGAPQAAGPSRGYTVSNRGREVPVKQARRLFPDHPYKLFLLGTLEGTAFYRIQVTPRYTCWGNGKAARIGEIGSFGCPNVVGAYPFQLEFKETRATPGSREIEYLRIAGIVVDQAASVALMDEQQRRIATVPVEANLYSFPPPYPRGFLRTVALDADGNELKPHPEWAERQTPPPNLFGPRATIVERPRLTAPIQDGAARGVRVRAGRNSVVAVDGSAIEPRARKLLQGRIGVNCFVLSANHRQTRSAGVSTSWRPMIAFKLRGIKAPLDGCDMQGTYGHRWRDQYGTHSAVEIPFNDRARRYFANRAAARDLALFVRSRKTQEIRRQTGSDLIAALRAAYGAQVRVLGSERAIAPPGVLGVWTSGNRTVFSERSSVGVRFFVELTNGKITKQNVRGLAFVF